VASIFSPAAFGLHAAPGSNGCVGNVVADTNHGSGIEGASGNPHASAGPGYFLAEEGPGAVPEAVHFVQSLC